MNFFNQNESRVQDRNFLELQTKLNYSYWIAADLEHYFDSHEKDINPVEYKKLLKQYGLAIDLFKSVDISSANISLDQKNCLECLKEHIYQCLSKELNFFDKKLSDSESEEMNISYQIDRHDNFQKKYMHYLHTNEFESYILRAYGNLGTAIKTSLQLNSDLEFDDYKKIGKKTYKVLKNFRLGRKELEKGINDPYVLEGILDEFAIISSSNSSDSDVKKYCDMQFDFLRLWKDYFLVCENFYSYIYDHNDESEGLAEINLFNHETNNYLGLINAISIRMHQFILSKLKVNIQEVEIYSLRMIKSPIDYIQNKNL